MTLILKQIWIQMWITYLKDRVTHNWLLGSQIFWKKIREAEKKAKINKIDQTTFHRFLSSEKHNRGWKTKQARFVLTHIICLFNKYISSICNNIHIYVIILNFLEKISDVKQNLDNIRRFHRLFSGILMGQVFIKKRTKKSFFWFWKIGEGNPRPKKNLK